MALKMKSYMMNNDTQSDADATDPTQAKKKTVSRNVWKKRMEERIKELNERTPGLSEFVKALERTER